MFMDDKTSRRIEKHLKFAMKYAGSFRKFKFEDQPIKEIKLTTNDKQRGIVSKFEVDGSKYRIMEAFGRKPFWFQYVPTGGRLYITTKCFDTLQEAKDYIYNADCP